MSLGRCNLRGPKVVDQGDGEITESRQELWGVARAQAGAVFLEAHIAHIMGAVFNTPMPAVELQQARGTGFGWSEGSDQINHLGRGTRRIIGHPSPD